MKKLTLLFRKPTIKPDVAWWKLDGNATDATGNGYDGNVYGATYVSNGKDNGCYYFDGNDDYIETGEVPDNHENARTIALWIKYEDASSRQSIFGGGGYLRFYFYNGDLHLRGTMDNEIGADIISYGDNNTNLFTEDYNTGVWIHIVGVWDRNNEMVLYINGERKSSLSIDDYGLQYKSNHIYIAQQSGFNRFYQGYIDDVMIYSWALSDSEVSDLYNSY